MKPNHHIIFTDLQWRCAINALDVLEVVIAGDQLDSYVLNDVRDAFPPTTIEETRSKLV